MKLPSHKTKIICTIGPACSTAAVVEELVLAGMSVARLNFSHGTPDSHRREIAAINEVSKKLGRPVGMFADLPGAKIRIGILPNEPLMLQKGELITLSVAPDAASKSFIPVEYKQLPESVSVGGTIYLNDGFIELRVEKISGTEVTCGVVMGGPLLSHKGLNLPGAKLFVDPVTDKDLKLVEFGLAEGIDTFGISFVENANDVLKVKDFAKKLGKNINAIAKIERSDAVKNFDDILNVADGIMIARGDLGVEMPIADVPGIQKKLIAKSNLWGRPVITATQMLESMKANTRPTRAEVSDVANAILDGTDAVMLSEETAIGKYPAETVRMMAAIAASAEKQRSTVDSSGELRRYLKEISRQGKLTIPDVISRNAVVAADSLDTAFILTPTDTGSTSRRVSRFKPNCWIMAFSRNERTCRFLTLSYGVYPSLMANSSGSWHEQIMQYLNDNKLVQKGDKLILTEGRFVSQPGGTDSLEIMTVK